jgi:hypothetical protein
MRTKNILIRSIIQDILMEENIFDTGVSKPPVILPPVEKDDDDEFHYTSLIKGKLLVPVDRLESADIKIPSLIHGIYNTEEKIGKFYIFLDFLGKNYNKDIFGHIDEERNFSYIFELESYFKAEKPDLHSTKIIYNLHLLIYDLFEEKFGVEKDEFYIKNIQFFDSEGTV